MKVRFFFIIIVCVFVLTFNAFAGSQSYVRISGIVEHPLKLDLNDLAQFQSVQVQLDEVTRDGRYNGVFRYRGAPLKTLLEIASIKKVNTDFSKNVDLAVIVTDNNGKAIVLSWGEIFYQNPADIIVAAFANPIIPHHSCKICHAPGVYKSRLAKLHRKIVFPKLVISEDRFSDRSLDGIKSIEVIDLHPRVVKEKQTLLFSPVLTITGAVKKPLILRSLSSYRHIGLKAKMIGEGKGYHGIIDFTGVPLKSLFEDAGLNYNLKTVFMVSAPDGYRALFSYGELFLNYKGDSVIIADRMDNHLIKKGGRFFLIQPADLMADRDVQSVRKIEVIQVVKPQKIKRQNS